jgi:hypothetical protein
VGAHIVPMSFGSASASVQQVQVALRDARERSGWGCERARLARVGRTHSGCSSLGSIPRRVGRSARAAEPTRDRAPIGLILFPE